VSSPVEVFKLVDRVMRDGIAVCRRAFIHSHRVIWVMTPSLVQGSCMQPDIHIFAQCRNHLIDDPIWILKGPS
jgi:hypothetical protein